MDPAAFSAPSARFTVETSYPPAENPGNFYQSKVNFFCVYLDNPFLRLYNLHRVEKIRICIFITFKERYR